MQEIKISLKEILSELRYEGYDEKKIASLIHEDLSGSGGIGYESDRTKGREKIIWKE